MNCTGGFALLETGWAAPLASDIVTAWIDLNDAPAYDLNDVWFDDFIYGD